MKVLKFGGTSVGSAESIQNVRGIVEAQTEPVIVVVSALGGVTDELIRISRMALCGDQTYLKAYGELAERHERMLTSVISKGRDRDTLLAVVHSLMVELRSIYQGVYLIRDLSRKTLAAIVSYGERLSSRIVACLVRGAEWYDSREFIRTETKAGRRSLAPSPPTASCARTGRRCRR